MPPAAPVNQLGTHGRMASQVLPTEGVRGDGEPMQTARSICMLTPLGSKRSPDIVRENSAEEEISICPETQPSPLESTEPEREELSSASKDVHMQAGGDGSADRALSEGSHTAADRVPCPLCDQGFPAAEIELHAMYCNGIVGEEAAADSPVLTRGRREARSKAAGGESSQTSSDSDKCEKCYLCKSLVPLLQYQRHVDSCLQAARQAQGTRRLRSTKVVARHKRGLLGMLELSESKSAGADTGTHIPGVGDQRDHTTLPRSAEDEDKAEHTPSAPPDPSGPAIPGPMRRGAPQPDPRERGAPARGSIAFQWRGAGPEERGRLPPMPTLNRCVGTVMWDLHPSALGPDSGPGPIAIVGRSCALYPRLPGRDSDRGTPQGPSAMDSCGWDAEGRPPGSLQLGAQDRGPSCTPVQRALLALTLTLEKLREVKGRVLEALELGLSQQGQARSTMRMLPTFICSTPDGTEKGDVLVAELRQSHVRTLWVTLAGDGKQSPQVLYRVFEMPGDVPQGSGEALFDFIAQCVKGFLEEIGNPQHRLPLGFVFPFSCRQTGLDKAELISWSKGFRCSDVEGRDVVQLLQAAISKQELHHVDVVALLNNTVGTMMTCSTREKPCEIALVVGSGTNCCFMAESHLLEMAEVTSGRMCVNSEWGCLGDDGALDDVLTPYDHRVDQESSNPGERRFEKLVGSLYLGEIVRHAMLMLASDQALFIGRNTSSLATKGVLTTQQVLEIMDNENGMAKAQVVLEALGLQPSERDCCRVQQLCRAVMSRAAALSATGLAAVLSHMCRSRQQERLVVNVGVDGGLYCNSTRFGEILRSVVGLLAPECTATLMPSADGSGLGAAVVTAVALRLAAQQRKVEQLLAPLRLSRADLERVQALMKQEMERGLDRESNAESSLRMLPTYVCHTPDGTERGEFLALDLGGTNFRVLVVRVTQDIHMASEIYVIPTAVMQGTGKELFDHIVECIVDFQTKQELMGQVLPLGFTFSFPCQQLGLDKAVLLNWTKGFSASGCVGQDVVQLLREAAQRKSHVGLKVVAVVNDTVGTMMACGYHDPKCEIGLIVGTGTNTCYMEEMAKVGTVEGDEGRMCINMEWGAFGDNGCLDGFFTSFDQLVDEKSINAGRQRFEKLISGMYLGEIVRYVLLAMVEEQVLFRGKPSDKLQRKDIFQTKFLSTIETPGLALLQVQGILSNLELDASFEDSVLVREVCETVSLRAAHLCAAGMAAVVEKMRESRGLEQLTVTVGVDGTLYKMHPHFSRNLQQMLQELAPRCNVTFMQSEDGSGKGAALVAAVACRGADLSSLQ
ncbi:hexokinase-3-like isoform X4 [Numida meleagris]|uniref:hexokinase-3-like isoform X4 n=1 Tax=Numida meleagris TaxID=8996 RepID=UPI000B3DF56A|nr:hexokinase-3-like isoform X4 [Numida meleagris]